MAGRHLLLEARLHAQLHAEPRHEGRKKQQHTEDDGAPAKEEVL